MIRRKNFVLRSLRIILTQDSKAPSSSTLKFLTTKTLINYLPKYLAISAFNSGFDSHSVIKKLDSFKIDDSLTYFLPVSVLFQCSKTIFVQNANVYKINRRLFLHNNMIYHRQKLFFVTRFYSISYAAFYKYF